jgi:hypothetical protein
VPEANCIAALAPEACAYIAGLIDGEGTITLTREHRGENRRLVVSIANTELALLDFVRQAVGAGRVTRKRVTSDAHTPSFAYRITSRQAVALLQQILPHLRSCKAQRAQLAVARYVAVTPRNGHYTAELRAERRRFEEEFLGLCSRGRA